MESLIADLLIVGKGITLTLELLGGGVLIGFVLGLILSICYYKNRAKLMISSFISVMRGTPLILQLSLIYFAIPTLTGITPSISIAGIIAFGLNSAAYFAEILKSGIQSIPKGQFEVAKTLQIPNFYLWKDIILPQVIKVISPALINEVIALLKETALISTIGGMDLMRQAQSLAAERFTYFLPLMIAAAYYYVLVIIIELLSKQRKWGTHHAGN